MLKYQIIDEQHGDNDDRNTDNDEQQEQKHVHNMVLSCGGRLFIRNKFNEYFNKIETKLEFCESSERSVVTAPTPSPTPSLTPANDLITKLTFPFPNRSNQYYFKKHLLNTLRPLLEQSYWYYESITESESLAFLKRTKPGTFLLRNSSNENYLLAISFQTLFGTISIRIDFKDNMFSLVPFDSNRTEEVPKFSNVISLIDFYRESKSLKLFGSGGGDGGKQANNFLIVFNANEGRKIPLSKSNPAFQLDSFTNHHHHHNNNNEDLEISLNLEITYPLYKQVPSLKHFCRLAINRSLAYQKVEFLEPDLLNYLNSYTFTI